MVEFFRLSDCDVIGFDLDHTLCRYQLRESSRLIYDSFAQYLVSERGYSTELLNHTPTIWDFCSKGLVLDLEEGNLLKLAGDGTVLRASHGTKSMTPEEISKLYGTKREWKHFKTISEAFPRSAKYFFYDNYFDLPGTLLCGRIVDCLGQNESSNKYDFWKDVVAAIEHNFGSAACRENSGFYFPAVKNAPSKYVQQCPESVRSWLRKLKKAGKVLALITSSQSDYCRLLCEQMFGKCFEEIFDIIITNALKPGFFSHVPQQRPFRTLENNEEQNVLLSLEKPGWYSQGNWAHLNDLFKKMTGKLEPKVVYFGDSMRSDIFSAHHYSHWDTVLILEELEADGSQNPEDTPFESLKKKVKYEALELKAPPCGSQQWGSVFVDNLTSAENGVETFVPTWFCSCISTYSTIAIPSIEAIADLPLDYKFTKFSHKGSEMDGYYPQAPQVLLSLNEPVSTQ